jgi:hypothetical protein
LTLVQNAAELTRWVDALLRDPVRRQVMANAAAASVRRHGDLPRGTAAALLALLPSDPA